MTLTELRDTLASVSEAVPVPTPDRSAFERRVIGVRRRRAAVRAGAAVAAVVVLAGGSVAVSSLGDSKTDIVPSHETAVDAPHFVPVLVEGHVRIVDGSITGPEGPAVASIVGSTPHGVVVLTDDGTLSRLDEQSSELVQLVPGSVRRAYLDGDAVVYENDEGLVRWRGIEPTVSSSDSAQTAQGQLMAAGLDTAVILEDQGLMLHESDGVRELFLGSAAIESIQGIEAASGVVAIRLGPGVVQFFYEHGLQGIDLLGDRIGSLAPDGHTYARAGGSGHSVELIDPRTTDATPVVGPAGLVSDLGWAPDGDLLVVVQDSRSRTLWRCSPNGTGCAAQVDDPTRTLSLG